MAKWVSLAGSLPLDTVNPGNAGTPIQPDVMLLLTDGSVFVHNGWFADWYIYQPNAAGDYTKGTWSAPFNMKWNRLYFDSGILPDGRVFVLGGEYSNDPETLSYTNTNDPNNNTNVVPNPGATIPAGWIPYADSPTGEIFDPGAPVPQWTDMEKPEQFYWIAGDSPSCMLGDGRVLFGGGGNQQTVLWDPQTNQWRQAGINIDGSQSKNGRTAEETWTLLPNGSVLTVMIPSGLFNPSANPNYPTITDPVPPVTAAPYGGNPAERYIPSLDRWVNAGDTQQTLPFNSAPADGEMGPAVLPDGRLFAIGASGYTALYTAPVSNDPSQPDDPLQAGTWTLGPTFPNDTSTPANNLNPAGFQTAMDAPGVLLTSGKVLCVAGNTQSQIVQGVVTGTGASLPAILYLYDPAVQTLPTDTIPAFDDQSALNGQSTTPLRFLMLPTGDVLLSAADGTFALLPNDAVDGEPQDAWRPAITSMPSQMASGNTYTITGTQFNGLSQACSYGDDAQMATNYPIFRLTGKDTGTVTYLRSSNFSTMQIATGNTEVSASVTVPAGMADGDYGLEVIANGIPSLTPYDVTLFAPPPILVFSSFEIDVFLDTEDVIVLNWQDLIPQWVTPPQPNPAWTALQTVIDEGAAGLEAAGFGRWPVFTLTPGEPEREQLRALVDARTAAHASLVSFVTAARTGQQDHISLRRLVEARQAAHAELMKFVETLRGTTSG